MPPTHPFIIQRTDENTPLSKAAARFNLLLKRLEAQEEKNEKLRAQLEEKLLVCIAEVLPAFNSWCETRMDFVEGILIFLDGYPTSQKNMPYVFSYCYTLLMEVLSRPHGLSAERMERIKEMFDFVAGQLGMAGFPRHISLEDNNDASEEAHAAQRFEDLMQHLSAYLEQMEVELDLSHFHSGMPEDEILEAVNRMLAEKLGQKPPKKKKPRKKSAAQQRKEDAAHMHAQLKDKSFAAMYKSLVKVLHPDAEIDETMKAKKTEWMQRLTVAYKNKDLKALLQIELEWMNKSADESQRWSEEKLGYFNEMLQKQVVESEQRYKEIIGDPRYRALAFFARDPHLMHLFKSAPYLNRLETTRATEITRLEALKQGSSAAKQEIKRIVSEMKTRGC
jgi:hypothetical protein